MLTCLQTCPRFNRTGPCLRDSFVNNTMAVDKVEFVVGAGLKAGAGVVVQIWTSNWSNGNATAETDLFQYAGEQSLAPVGADGVAKVTVTVHVDQVITISTLSRADGYGRHGAAATLPPVSAPFPSSYANDFDSLPLNADEPYLSDQAGHWEVRADSAAAAAITNNSSSSKTISSSNQVLKHVCPEIGVVYRGDRLPIGVLGGVAWRDTAVSLRFRWVKAHIGPPTTTNLNVPG